MLKMLMTPREILRFPRQGLSGWDKTEMGNIRRWWEVLGDQGGKHLVTSSVAWRPISNTGASQ